MTIKVKPIAATKAAIADVMSAAAETLGGASNVYKDLEARTCTPHAHLDVDGKFASEQTIVYTKKVEAIDNLEEPEEVQLKPLDAVKVTLTETLNAVASAACGLSHLAKNFEEWSRDLPERARHAAELSHAAAIEQSKKELLEFAQSRGFETVEAMIEENRKFVSMLKEYSNK